MPCKSRKKRIASKIPTTKCPAPKEGGFGSRCDCGGLFEEIVILHPPPKGRFLLLCSSSALRYDYAQVDVVRICGAVSGAHQRVASTARPILFENQPLPRRTRPRRHSRFFRGSILSKTYSRQSFLSRNLLCIVDAQQHSAACSYVQIARLRDERDLANWIGATGVEQGHAGETVKTTRIR